METTPSRRRRFRPFAALLPLLVLLLLEGGLRLGGFRHRLDPPVYRFSNPEGGRYLADEDGVIVRDERLFWRMRAGWTSPDGIDRINDRGFRTRTWTEPKPEGVTRIVCLGDSVTFGLQVTRDEAWPAVLGARLRTSRRDPSIEVVNLGTPGYTSYQARLLVEDRLKALEPDVVVVAFGVFNDWVPARGRTDAEQRPAAAWRSVRVVELAAAMVGVEGAEDLPMEPALKLKELDTRGVTAPRRVPPDAFEENLHAIAERAKALGAPTVFVAPALPAATVERNPIARTYAAATRNVAGELGLPAVDVGTVYAASGLDEPALFHDFCHPSIRGHETLADAVVPVVAGVLDGE